MNRMNKRMITVLVGLGLVVAGAGAAYAYWTGGGSGEGAASTGTNSGLTANQTSIVANMGPGDSAQTLTGDFDNPNDGPVYATSVTASITGVAGGEGACTADDYTLADAVMTVDAEVPAGDAQGAWTGATIQFNNTTANQDGCKNAVVTLGYAIN